MNGRERILAMVLVAVILLGGGAALGLLVYWPMVKARQANLKKADENIVKKEFDLLDMRMKQDRMDQLRGLGLPASLGEAAKKEPGQPAAPPAKAQATWLHYQNYLRDLLDKSRFRGGAVNITHTTKETPAAATARSKKLPYSVLTFKLDGHGTLAQLVAFLEGFYRAPLLHQVKTLSLRVPQTERQGQGKDELDVMMEVEALILEGTKPRSTLLAEGAAPLAVLAEKPRDYPEIAKKNIFFGPAPPPPPSSSDDVPRAKYTFITAIREDVLTLKVVAFYRDQASPHELRRLSESAAFRDFELKEGQNDILRCHVLRIDVDNRELFFRVEGKDRFYRIHSGQLFEDALKNPIKDSEAKSLGLVEGEGEAKSGDK